LSDATEPDGFAHNGDALNRVEGTASNLTGSSVELGSPVRSRGLENAVYAVDPARDASPAVDIVYTTE
jgi:hypothetical protein